MKKELANKARREKKKRTCGAMRLSIKTKIIYTKIINRNRAGSKCVRQKAGVCAVRCSNGIACCVVFAGETEGRTVESGKFFLDPFFRVIWKHFLSTVQLAVVVGGGRLFARKAGRDSSEGSLRRDQTKEQKIFQSLKNQYSFAKCTGK